MGMEPDFSGLAKHFVAGNDRIEAEKYNVSEARYRSWKDQKKTLPSRRKLTDNPLMGKKAKIKAKKDYQE